MLNLLTLFQICNTFVSEASLVHVLEEMQNQVLMVVMISKNTGQTTNIKKNKIK